MSDGASVSTAGTETAADPSAPAPPDSHEARPAAQTDNDELQALRGRPLAEHAAGYERIHEQLQATLAAIDTA